MATLTSFSSFGMAILIFFQTLLAPLGISLNFGGVYNSKDKYAYDFAYSTEKIMQYDKLGKDSEASVYLAKDEREGCQFVLRARKANARNTVVTVSDFVSDNGEVLPHETFVVKYVNTSKSALQQSYPDPVVPYEGESIKIYSTESTAFYIELRSSPNTPAGVYRASVTVTDTSSGNTELANIPITATVWNFTLPKTPSCKTMMGLMCGLDSPEIFYSLNGVDINDPEQQNEALEVYKEYYEFMLDRKVSPYMLPYDITDPRADSYLNDPRMTSFTIPVLDENNIESKVKAYHDKLSKNPEWASKSFYYPVDEPVSGEQYLKFYDNVDKIRAICGNDCNIYTPFYKETIWYNGISYNALDLLDGKSDMICPITSLFPTHRSAISLPVWLQTALSLGGTFASTPKITIAICLSPTPGFSIESFSGSNTIMT